MSCPDVLENDDPLKDFSEGLLNFHNHFCRDAHDSQWCKYHPKENENGSPYSVKIPLTCPVQGKVFKNYWKAWQTGLKNMSLLMVK